MIERVSIENFKSIKNESFDFRPFTILTGMNSSGKSSIIQTILLMSYYSTQNQELEKAISRLKYFEQIKNIDTYNKSVNISILENEKVIQLQNTQENGWSINEKSSLSFEDNLYYLNSNRMGQQDLGEYSDDVKFGIDGRYAFGYFQKHKSDHFSFALENPNGEALAGQLRYWSNYILDSDLELITDDINSSYVSIGYRKNKETYMIMSPFNVGAGVSYVIRILILSLSLKAGDIFIVENPEIHLHPKAVSKLLNFFVFLVKNGVQVIMETHSEYFINGLRYDIFKQKLRSDDAIIYYKDNVLENFFPIKISENGKFTDNDGKTIKFPSGFLDANLRNLLEMM